MGSSGNRRTLSVDKQTNTISVKAKEKAKENVGKTGHVYELLGIMVGKKINDWKFNVVVTLFDHTLGKEIKKSGTKEETFKAGVYIVWIKNIEGHKEVILHLYRNGELGKIQEQKNRNDIYFSLDPWMYENM
jgi:hypothetical protein